ncbi:hypothetical protein [Streptomyces genisteinicus]|uniref:Uncharacterized protein n=1 Tax=Streptomyces genisteinicus TaxID=2768068 RepID=A0A7H0HYK6_9ACTN|nr:hypothetical protein [Streptomyces genisteinicus]QNP65622.1 hypothetical protein IAG43_23620 [Streptomyces genisteinicus]
MIAAAVFAGVFAVAFTAFGLFVDPRRLWWRFRAPGLDDPGAHEPSSASFLWRRVLLVGLGLFLGWQAVGALRLAGVFETGADHAEILDRVEYAALNLETEDGEGRHKWPGGDGAWDAFIDPRLKGPERDDPVAVLVDEEEAEGDWDSEASRQGGASPEPGGAADPAGPFTERYEIGGICLTVHAVPLPGQSERDAALDSLLYRVSTDIVDAPCG